MRRLALLSCCSIILAASAAAQVHVVQTVVFQFVDSVSGNSHTTVTLGETIQWQVSDSFVHLVLDGVDTQDPNFGARFNFPLDGANPTFQYTPTDIGTFPYFCFPHFGFGMTGTVTVLPPGPPLGGTGDDLILGTVTDGFTAPGDQYLAGHGGDYLTVTLDCASGSFDFLAPILALQLYPTGGTPPASPPGFPAIRLSFGGAFAVLNATPGPLGFWLLPPSGLSLINQIPPGLAGTTVRLQGFVPSSSASNGLFAATDAHDILVLP